ncbi:MAG: HEAT repeat domain-containing protein, partial [Usitatibacteraceae bacterium]
MNYLQKKRRWRAAFRGLIFIAAMPVAPAVTASTLTFPQEGWVSWQVSAVADAPSWCCFGPLMGNLDPKRQSCELDGSEYGYGALDRHEMTDSIRVYARFGAGKLERVRALAASCPVNAASPIRTLNSVGTDESAKWLVDVVLKSTAGAATVQRNRPSDAMAALAMHRGDAARDALANFARKHTNPSIRKDAAFWLAQVRGSEGAAIVLPLMFDDIDAGVREHAAFAISQSKTAAAVPSLIKQGNTDRDTHVRSQAWFWLSQTQSEETESAIRAALQNEKDSRVREQAVFALSRLPEDRAARALML